MAHCHKETSVGLVLKVPRNNASCSHKEYGAQDGLTPENTPHYYELFRDKRYCLLVFLENVREVGPFHVDKTGFGAMAAWITLPSVEHIKATG